MKKYFIQLMLVLFCFSLNATTVTWNGGTGLWDDPTKWNSGLVPTINDSVVISNNGYVIYASGTNANVLHITIEDTLVIRKNATLTIANSPGVGLNNFGYFTNKGMIIFFNTADNPLINYSKLINYKEGTITVSSTYGGIEVEPSASLKNSGTIFIDDTSGFGIDSDGIIVNKEGGKIDMYFTGGFRPLGTTTNQGTINVISSSLAGLASFRDPFINDKTGVINLDDCFLHGIYLNNYFTNKGIINISNIDGEGIYSDLGVLNNTKKGEIYISEAREQGINLIQSARVVNRGLIQLDGNYGLEALRLRSLSSIENSGKLILNTSAPCTIDTASFFYNEPCGTFKLDGAIINDNYFENEGWLRSTLNGTHTNNHLFFNEAVIEDINGSFNGVNINNNAIRIAPLNVTGIKDVPIPNALDLGSLTGFQLSNNKWYTNSSLTIEAGDYDPVLNQFTPRANAVGLSKFFMRVADLNNNCREIFYIEISGGVLAGPTPPPSGPSVGGPIIKADFKQAYSLNIYPNPTSEGFTITSSAPLSHKTTVSLYDLQGRLIERKDFKAEDQSSIYFKLSPSYLQGLYLLKIQEEGQVLVSKRLTISPQ